MSSRGAKVGALVAAVLVLVGVLLYAGTLGVLTGAVQPGPRASSALSTVEPSAAIGSPTTGPRVPGTTGLPGTTGSPTVVFPTTVQLSTPSGDVVWALVGANLLFRSIDRGETWLERPLPPSAPNLEQAFVSEREGFISSAGSRATQCLFQSIQIWRTADGGSSYERLPATGIAEGQCKAGLSFVDAQHGFISAWSQSSAPVVYRTSDGGQSWAPSRPLPDPPGFTTQPSASSLQVGPGPIRAFGSTLLLQAVGNVLSGERHFIFRSVDGGATWSYLAAVPIPAPVAFVTATRWIQVRLQGLSQETTDAGATWHAFAADYGQASPYAPVVIFPDPEVGYATNSRGGFQRTVDGGLHWRSLKTPGCC